MHKFSGQIIAEIHPNGLLVLRQKGRRAKYTTTLATIYTRLIWADAMKAAKAKKAARKKR